MRSKGTFSHSRITHTLLVALGLGTAACGGSDGIESQAGGSKSGSGDTGNGDTANTGSSSSPGGQSGNTENTGSDAPPPFECESQGLAVNMVSVPEGEFIMGCNEDVDDECAEDEFPQRVIVVSAFEIDETEVTQDQYAACVQAGACSPPSCEWDCSRSDYPAGCVDRAQARTYCEWAGKRLPTEAEWEKSARGADGLKYPWGNEEPTCNLLNMAGCAGEAEPVGSHPEGASPYGALDMAGNMVEMLSDWYDPSYYERMPEQDPQGPMEGDTYVGRGGGFLSEPFWNRASVRDWYNLEDAGKSLGFRCAR